jgi:hypothetical protein
MFMVKRAFLLLLAIMAGLTTAEAGEQACPGFDAFGVNATCVNADQAVVERVQDARIVQATSFATASGPAARKSLRAGGASWLSVQTTHRADRALE